MTKQEKITVLAGTVDRLLHGHQTASGPGCCSTVGVMIAEALLHLDDEELGRFLHVLETNQKG